MQRLLTGLTIILFTAVAATKVSGQLNESVSFDFNSDPSIESLEWTFRNRGPVRADIVERSTGNQAIRIHSDAKKSMAMFSVNINPEQVQNNVTVFKAELRTQAVEQGAHLMVQIKDGDQRIFKEDMRNTPIRGNTDWQSYQITIPQLSNAGTVQIGFMLFGVGEVWLDNVSLQPFEPEQGTANTDYDGSLLANQFYQLIAEHYLKSRELDLPELKERVLAAGKSAKSEAELSALLKSFVSSVGDRHMSYIERQASSQLSKKTYVAQNTVQVKEGVAYVHLASPQSSAEHLQDSIEKTASTIQTLHQQGAKSWIIDLRGHTGGNSFAYLDMIYPLLPQGRASGMRDHNELEIYHWITEKGVGVGSREKLLKLRSSYGAAVSNPISLSVPLAVLIDKDTASAGEFVALVLRERPNTKIFGEQSDGLLSANAPQTLLNGDILVLPTSQAINNDGMFQYAVEPDVHAESSQAFQRAVEWLQNLE